MALLARLFVPVCLAAFGVIYYVNALKIRSLYDTGPVGASDFPKILVVLLGLGLVAAVISDLRKPRTEQAPIDWGGLLAAALVIVASAGFVALFRPIGYFAATGLYALVLLAIFSRFQIRPLPAILYTVALVGAVYLLFAVLFNVRLPETPYLESIISSTPAETPQ